MHTQHLGNTWEWDGAWQRRTPATVPTPADNPAMAYDSDREVTVMVPIPAQPSLIFAEFAAQAGFLAPMSQLAWTSGVRVLVGE